MHDHIVGPEPYEAFAFEIRAQNVPTSSLRALACRSEQNGPICSNNQAHDCGPE